MTHDVKNKLSIIFEVVCVMELKKIFKIFLRSFVKLQYMYRLSLFKFLHFFLLSPLSLVAHKFKIKRTFKACNGAKGLSVWLIERIG